MNDELERLMREAQTDEPWTVVWYGDEHLPAIAIHRSAEDRVCFMPTIQHPADGVQAEANAALIVAAVNALPDLLAERDRLREALAFIVKQVENSPVNFDGSRMAWISSGAVYGARAALNQETKP